MSAVLSNVFSFLPISQTLKEHYSARETRETRETREISSRREKIDADFRLETEKFFAYSACFAGNFQAE